MAVSGIETTSRHRFGCRPNEFYRRIVLLTFAILISIPVFYTSRPAKDDSHPRAAFPVLTSARGYVRIEGCVRFPGIFSITAKNMTIDAIKMAGPYDSDLQHIAGMVQDTPLKSGDVVNILKTKDETLRVCRGEMTTHEKLLLGIPLNINRMSKDDFDKLPGIGPTLAQRIVEYRHKNGDSMVITDLLAVEGVGENTYKRLRKYF